MCVILKFVHEPITITNLRQQGYRLMLCYLGVVVGEGRVGDCEVLSPNSGGSWGTQARRPRRVAAPEGKKNGYSKNSVDMMPYCKSVYFFDQILVEPNFHALTVVKMSWAHQATCGSARLQCQ